MGKLIPSTIRLAYLNLQRNRRRNMLSILIIAIAVFALTAAGGFGLYTYDSLKESTARDTGHLTISQPGFFEQDEEMPLASGIVDSDVISKRLLANSDIRGVQPRIEFSGLISNGSKSTIFMGTGVNEREFDMKGPFLDVREGKTLSNIKSSRYDEAEPEVMLGLDLARNLKVSIGDWVTLLATTSDGALNAYDYKVRGIYSTGVPELDKRQLYIHVRSAQDLLSSDKVSTLSVFLFETDKTESVGEWVSQKLNTMELKQPLEVTPWQDRAFFYTKVKDLYDRIFGIMGAVMALVVFVALFNTLTMSVTERTREIGTLSALGTFPSEIVSGFVRESALLAMIGSFVGGALSALVSLFLLFVEVEMPPPPGRSEGYPLNIYFSFELLAASAVGVLMICIVAAWISAQKGVKKPITEALVYV